MLVHPPYLEDNHRPQTSMSLLSRGDEDDDDDSFRRFPSLSRRDSNTLRLGNATDDSFRRSPLSLSRRDDSTLRLAASNTRPLELMLNDLDDEKVIDTDDCVSLDADLPSLASIRCGSVFSTRTTSISNRDEDLSTRGRKEGCRLRNVIMMDLLREEQNNASSLSLGKTLEILEPVASNGNALKKEARWANSSVSNLLLNASNHSINLKTLEHSHKEHTVPLSWTRSSPGRHTRPKSTRGTSTSRPCMTSKGSGRGTNMPPTSAASCGRASQLKDDKVSSWVSSKDPRAELTSSNHSASEHSISRRSHRRGVVPPSRGASSNRSGLKLLDTSSYHSNRSNSSSLELLSTSSSHSNKSNRDKQISMPSPLSASGHSAHYGDDAPRKPHRKNSVDAETIRNTSADKQGLPRRGRRKLNSPNTQQGQHRHSQYVDFSEESLPNATDDGRRRSIDCLLAPPQRSRSGQ